MDKAIEYYSKCIDMNPDSRVKSEVEKLLSNAKKTLYKAEVKSLIDGEKSISDKDITKGSAAIVPFYNRGDKGDYDVLQKGIPQMMITDFGYVPSINILERLRIEELIKEMKLSETNLVEKGTAQRLGKLLKAENIVSGSYTVSSTNTVKIDVFVINVITSQISDIVEKSGTIEDFFNVQKDISLAALDKMGVRVTDDQRRKIKTLPTETFFEFLAALKKKTVEEEEFVFQGADFLNNLMTTVDIPVNQVSTTTVSPEIKPTINPVETPLPRPPSTPR
jgi:TolB-like protein